MGCFILFLVIDAKNKIAKINQKNQAAATVSEVAQQPEPAQTPAQPNVNYHYPNTQPVENTGLTPTSTSEQDALFEEIEPPENAQSANEPRKIEPINIETRPASIQISDLGVNKLLNEYPDNFKFQDTRNNTVYLVPNSFGTKMPEGSLGLLIKVSPEERILWQKEIYKIGNDPYTLTGIKFAGDRIRLSLSKSSEDLQPIIMNKDGNIMYNPHQIKFSSTFAKQPGTYILRVLNVLQYKNKDYVVIAYINKNNPVRPHYLKAEYYLYQAENNQLQKKAYLFDYEVLDVSTYLPMVSVTKNQDGIRLSTFNEPKKEKSLTLKDLEKPAAYSNTAAPTWIQSGISSSVSNYVITINQ